MRRRTEHDAPCSLSKLLYEADSVFSLANECVLPSVIDIMSQLLQDVTKSACIEFLFNLVPPYVAIVVIIHCLRISLSKDP